MNKQSRVEIDRNDDHIALVTISRIERRNAFDDEMIEEFHEVFDCLGRGDTPRVIILTGAGNDSFCAGYDVNCIDPPAQEDMPLPDTRFEKTIEAIREVPCPVIAAVNGDAYGGGLDMILSCDLRIARRGARFAMTPCKLGLVYSRSGIARFVDRIGFGPTRQLFLTAAPVSHEQALDMKIVDEVCDASDLMSLTFTLARTIASNAPLAVHGTRATIQSLESNFQPGNCTKHLDQLRDLAFKSNYLAESLAAFKKRREPAFGNE